MEMYRYKGAYSRTELEGKIKIGTGLRHIARPQIIVPDRYKLRVERQCCDEDGITLYHVYVKAA